MENKKHYIIPIFVPHIGCPHNCVFCNQGKITGQELKNMLCKEKLEVTGESTRKTIEEYLETIDKDNAIIEVSFFGGTFTGIPIEKQKELLAVAKEYKDKKKINYIRMSTRPDYIDENILQHLKKYDADIIELGVQSLDDDVLKKSGRGHSSEDVKKASKLIKDFGFTLGHQIMLGLPGDTFEKDIYTCRESIKMLPDICRIYPSLVIKDTPMEEMYKKEIYRPYSLKDAVSICAVLYAMYLENNVNVIRIGLQPTENINYNGDIVAGPFHPAFRELVESLIYNKAINEYIKELGDDVLIKVNPKDISKLYANKKQFFNDMIKQNNNKNFKVLSDELVEKKVIFIDDGTKKVKVSINFYLKELIREGKNFFS